MSSFSARFAEKAGTRRVVGRTTEFRRIAAIPWRYTYQDNVEVLTEHFRRKNGDWMLRQEQAWALSEMAQCGGLLGGLEVGAGKTLITLLAPEALDARRPMLVVPASLRVKTKKDFLRYNPKFRCWPDLYNENNCISYQMLAQANRADTFKNRQPDVVICDEAHHLKNKNTAAWRRIERYAAERPNTKWVFLTGTLTAKSLRDYAHLAKLALKDASPLPHRFIDLEDWADLLDVHVDESQRPDPGAILDFCEEGESPRTGFRKRLIYTAGVVNTPSPAITVPIKMRQLDISVPENIKDVFREYRDTWVLPSGEVAASALDFFRHANELTLGFYNRWVWPNNRPDVEWLEARKNWASFVNKTIKASGSKKLKGQLFDTELQVWRACKKGNITAPDKEFENWQKVKTRKKPDTQAVWLSDYMLKFVEEWIASDARPGIVWVHNNPFLDRLRAMGIPCYGAGEDSIEEETKSCVASLIAHGTGKNLQHHHRRMLYLAIPTTGVKWEQSIGRIHRPGIDETIASLDVDLVLACFESWNAFQKAREGASYIEETTGMRQKLNAAKVDCLTDDQVRKLHAMKDPLWDSDNAAKVSYEYESDEDEETADVDED